MAIGYSHFLVQTERKTQVVNLTEKIREACAGLGPKNGILLIGVRHTTCAVCVNEDEAGLRHDFERLGEALLDPFRGQDGYRHDRIDDNAQAHLTSILLGQSVTLPLRDRLPVLGTWQSILLLEMDGPRPRTLDLTAFGE
ncbi:MAG: secondary thiamine-phosphate synthase enzyme YjbQ [Acidobacteria bacterium]|nr:secondary thiamine-phosphate synthase enzyme YjbQ [Acidobacteriota bacterium]